MVETENITVFLAVTNDVYELPIAVEDTLRALCKRLGLLCDTVAKSLKAKTEPIIKLRHGEKVKILEVKI